MSKEIAADTISPKPRNPSPKESFRSSAYNQAKHRELVALPQFEAACAVALLEQQRQIIVQANGNPNAAMAGFYRMQGANEVLDIIRNLAEGTNIVPIRRDTDNLNHAI